MGLPFFGITMRKPVKCRHPGLRKTEIGMDSLTARVIQKGGFVMDTIWIATGNAHKAEEFQEMLGPSHQVKTLRNLEQMPEIDETGKTFEENALIKARTLHGLLKEAVIADDSGLEVDAMDKMPGIYSSRFMGEDTAYAIKNQAIIDTVDQKEREEGRDRKARFVCAIAWIEKDGTEHLYRGVMEGEIAHEITGEGGFGYDPIFWFELFGTTSGNVPADLKNRYSHRHAALEQFMKDWREKR